MPASIRFGRGSVESYLERTANLPSAGAVTIMGWFKYAAAVGGGLPVAVVLAQDGGNAYALECGTNTSGVWALYGGTKVDLSPQIVTGRWVSAALVSSDTAGANLRCYLDGVLAATANSISMSPTMMAFASAGTLVSGYACDCQWAAIKIWNRALTRAEIVAEMPYALPVNRAGLNSCYPVPNGWDVLPSGIAYPRAAKTRWADWSGNGLEWTETGAIDTEPGPPIQWAPQPARPSARRLRLAGSLPPLGIWRPLVHSQRA